MLLKFIKIRRKICERTVPFRQIRIFNYDILLISFLLILIQHERIGADSPPIQAPRFTTQPSSSSSIVSETGTKILQCHALGYPQPVYKWLKNGVSVTEFTNGQYYRIQNANKNDVGSYSCLAKNDAGTIFSEKINIAVAYMEGFQDLTERTVSVLSGHAAILDLALIDSVPKPQVTWLSAEGPLDYDIKYATTLDNQLIILSVSKSDELAYRARAINTQLGKEEYSPFIRLNVTGDEYMDVAPQIIVSPRSVKAVKGEEIVEIQCIANAKYLHELETLWFKDEIPIENAGIRYTFNDPWNRTMALMSLNMTHNGMYVCKVRLKSGGFEATTDSAEIVVQEQPSFFQPLRSEILGDFGSSLTIPCDAIGEPFPNITWYKDAKLLDLSSDRYAISESNALVIKKLSLDDSAMFQCLAENDAGEKSTYTWVKVKTSKPVMDVAPQNTTVLDGKDATIQCQVTGYPKPNVTWIYNETIFIQNDSRYQVLESGDLLVENVKETDAGLYKCVRSNEAGTVVGESYLTVLVRTQIVQPPVDTTVLLGTTAALQCRVSSDPKVPFNIDWYRESRTMPITNGQRIQVKADGTLEIQAVRAADVGEYACVVTSPGGNETRSARLSVVELPFPPINVRAERLPYERDVNVTWTPGFDGNSKILKFIVQKREEEEGIVGPIPDMLQKWVTCASNVSADSRSVVIKNLRAATSYQFRVSAVNNVGEGSPSESSNTIKLPQEAPSGPPLSFVGSARSSSEIITQWQPPAEEHRNGQILGYIIRFRLFGYNISWYYRNVTNEAQRSYLIQDLITWKDYIVQIAAYNNMGVGVYTEGAKIKTKEGVPEAPPTNLKAMVVNSTAVQISWLPPNPQRINGINQGYKLQAWRMETVNGEMEEIETRIKNVPPNLLDPLAEQSAIMDDLEKYTDYNFTVLCFTNPGDGVRSEKVLVKTEQDVPDEITALQFSDISDRELKVSWKSPKKTNGILTGYQLKYQIKDFPNTLKVVNLTSNETVIRVRELMATTHYTFEVTAWTIVGAGPPKTATIQSGIKPTNPHAPKNLALSNIGAFSVVLQFTPGFDGNSSIIYWIIQAQTSRNMSWFNLTQIHDPEASSLLVNGLKPFSQYKLRIAAMNVAGTSEFSEATKEFQTIMAPPKNPPLNVTVRAISGKELRIRWIPLQNSEWFGNPKGYNISYKHINSFDGVFNFSNIFVDDPTANSFILENLEEWSVYEIAMSSCNEVGCSPDSPVAVERTREAVPSEGPSNVQANATSSTTIVVTWQDVTKQQQNGLIEGYKVLYSHPGRASVLKKEIPQNSTFTTTLTELKKFTIYTIQVLAYTRLGDGALSLPLRVQTFDDTPGVPSNVSFPDVSFSTARIIWDVPEEPNGEILAYRVTYALNGSSIQNFSKEFPSSDRTYRATNLEAEKYYLFSVTAQTRLGWGRTGYFLVFTTNSREIPQAPSAPQISRGQIQSKQITFNWTPGRDGLAPLRYYSIQYRENDGPWTAIPERVDPMVVSYTATNLKPFSIYQFRIQATNDIGSSTYSKESTDVRTLSAAPSKGIENLKVVPITTTSVRVQWTALKKNFWNGDFATGGYRVFFQQVTEFQSALQEIPKFDVMGIDKEDVVLNDLTQDNNYEISVAPFNSQGVGLVSTPIVVYVGEAVPTGEPREVKATALSSTEVFLEWKPPKHDMQNGDLLGYKIFYVVTDFSNHIDQKHEEEIEVVPASYNSHSLVFLDKFTEYKIQILAFNPAGDGPRSKAVKIKTHQDLPGPPSNLRFADITMNSLEVSWNTPKNRNGEILGYVVTYETTEDNEKFSKQVKQKVTGNSLVVQNLEEEVTYTFTVRAQTIDYGPAVSGNVTTGPQEGSPVALRELHLSKNLASVDLHWMNGLLIKDKILGYYIESKKRDDSRWQLVVKTTNGPMQDFTISYQTLLPSTSYKFRVSAYNKYGISYPINSKESILTPSKLYLEYGYLQQKPFYRQTWFMISLAATSVIIIIMVVAILCVKSKSYKYKQEAQKTLEESMAMSIDERQELALELYRSRHGMGSTGAPSISGTLGRRTLGRKSNNPTTTAASLGKTPPRPSPASVHYHSDEESLKCYDENPDDSSVTEKPSEMSSSDSQNSESENESVHNDPHSFVNHYANVNDSLKQSWNRQKPVRNYSSYTDSEPEGSTVMSLNGGQIIMNNMARSRAPLPGFSSFV